MRDTAEIVKKDVNLRREPTRDSEIVAPLPIGTKVRVIGRLADGTWLKVLWKDHEAWVRTELVALNTGTLEYSPVVNP